MFSAASVEFLGHVLEEGCVLGWPQEGLGGGGVAATHGPDPSSGVSWGSPIFIGASFGGSAGSPHHSPHSRPPLTPVFPGHPEAEDAFVALKRLFTTARSSSSPTPIGSSSWRLTRLTRASGLYSSRGQKRTNRFTRLPSCPDVSLRLNAITMWGTESSWSCTLPWRSGDTGWRGPNTPCSYGPTTRT